MPITDELAPDKRVKIHELPAIEKMACVVHNGSFATIGEAYDAIAKWIDQNDPNTVNEIQFPVEKA